MLPFDRTSEKSPPSSLFSEAFTFSLLWLHNECLLRQSVQCILVCIKTMGAQTLIVGLCLHGKKEVMWVFHLYCGILLGSCYAFHIIFKNKILFFFLNLVWMHVAMWLNMNLRKNLKIKYMIYKDKIIIHYSGKDSFYVF